MMLETCMDNLTIPIKGLELGVSTQLWGSEAHCCMHDPKIQRRSIPILNH